jgi:hypothetical protein
MVVLALGLFEGIDEFLGWFGGSLTQMSGDVAGSLVERLEGESHTERLRRAELGFYPATSSRASAFLQDTEKGNREKGDFTRPESAFGEGAADSGKQIVDETIIRP